MTVNASGQTASCRRLMQKTGTNRVIPMPVTKGFYKKERHIMDKIGTIKNPELKIRLIPVAGTPLITGMGSSTL